MIQSMTGFGKATAGVNDKKITVEIKSLNSKQLDLTVKMPALYREKEGEIRNLISQQLIRGKIEAFVYLECENQLQGTVFNQTLIATYRNQIEEISRNLNIPLPQDLFAIILRMPDVFKNDNNIEISEDEAETLLSAVSEAASRLITFRKTEGLKLEEFFVSRIKSIRDLLKQIEPFEVERVPKIKSKIEENLRKLTGIEIDKGRLEQEMIYYIEKLDINEEKQRLTQHLDYFTETMNAESGQGKKLGFITQEIGREINTLGSKSNHAEMQKIVVRMKDELEQIKEQVLNVL